MDQFLFELDFCYMSSPFLPGNLRSLLGCSILGTLVMYYGLLGCSILGTLVMNHGLVSCSILGSLVLYGMIEGLLGCFLANFPDF